MARSPSLAMGSSLCRVLGNSRARLNQPALPCSGLAFCANSVSSAGWVPSRASSVADAEADVVVGLVGLHATGVLTEADLELAREATQAARQEVAQRVVGAHGIGRVGSGWSALDRLPNLS